MEQSQAPEEHIRQYPKSILDRGYGMVGKYVMQDRELHVIAKAIYSYVCTFGNCAFPGRDKICYDLQINKNTYAKYMKQLVDYGYITVIQSRSGNQKFFRNTYEINLDPQRVLELRAEKVELPEESAPDRSIEKRRRQEAIAAQKARIEAMFAAEKEAYEPVTVPGCEGLHGTDLVQAWKQRVKGTGSERGGMLMRLELIEDG